MKVMKTPKTVDLDVTNRCNLRCRYCYHFESAGDVEKDLSNKKRTLANISGRRASRWEYDILIGGSFVCIVLLVFTGVAPAFTLLALVTLPMAVDLIRTAALFDEPARLNKVVRGTAVLHQRFGWLMILGVISAIVANVV